MRSDWAVVRMVHLAAWAVAQPVAVVGHVVEWGAVAREKAAEAAKVDMVGLAAADWKSSQHRQCTSPANSHQAASRYCWVHRPPEGTVRKLLVG